MKIITWGLTDQLLDYKLELLCHVSNNRLLWKLNRQKQSDRDSIGEAAMTGGDHSCSATKTKAASCFVQVRHSIIIFPTFTHTNTHLYPLLPRHHLCREAKFQQTAVSPFGVTDDDHVHPAVVSRRRTSGGQRMETSGGSVQTYPVSSWNTSLKPYLNGGHGSCTCCWPSSPDTGGGKCVQAERKGRVWSPFNLGCAVFHRLGSKMHPPTALTCAQMTASHWQLATAPVILSPYATVWALMHASSQCLLCENSCSTVEAPDGGTVALSLRLKHMRAQHVPNCARIFWFCLVLIDFVLFLCHPVRLL